MTRLLTRTELTVDLGAIRRNHQILLARLDGRASLAAMVKADGYGLGATPVASALWDDGCRWFFVAHLDEGLELRGALPDDATISVLNGAMPGTEAELAEARLVPVLNSLDQVELWGAEARRRNRVLDAVLHVDTGMNRLGMPREEAGRLADEPERLDAIDVVHVMSHLASADVPGSDQSARQLKSFGQIRQHLPMGTASLANSAGVFLGLDYHFDVVRPGIALYGGTPVPGRPNPMECCTLLETPVLQVRAVGPGDTVGYGATHEVTGPARIATVEVGYADGFLRAASNRGQATIAGVAVPVVGRVSMDLVTLDVTAVPERDLHLGAPVELLGPNQPVDAVAARAGTIANEVLTDLGRRYHLTYVGRPKWEV